jgi:hypothetical protein
MRKLLSMTFVYFLIGQFVTAQNIIGKKFEGEYRTIYACGKNSGCTSREYCLLDFKKNKVNVSFRSVHERYEAGKHTIEDHKYDKIMTYEWKKKGNKIYIENFSENFNVNIIEGNKLLVWVHGKKTEYLLVK